MYYICNTMLCNTIQKKRETDQQNREHEITEEEYVKICRKYRTEQSRGVVGYGRVKTKIDAIVR